MSLTCGNDAALHGWFSARGGTWRHMAAFDFQKSLRDPSHMDKAEHGERLAAAMGAKRLSRGDVAGVVNRDVRTITNWTAGSTMPTEAERAVLRQLLGDYDSPGDPVEVALRGSELVEWRRDTVTGFYKMHLAQQREERGTA